MEPVVRSFQSGLTPVPGQLTGVGGAFVSGLPVETEVIGETYAFKTSVGAEIRFFMPVLNVPFRLIFAHNPSRVGVLDNNGQPAKKWTFKFAVGSTF